MSICSPSAALNSLRERDLSISSVTSNTICFDFLFLPILAGVIILTQEATCAGQWRPVKLAYIQVLADGAETPSYSHVTSRAAGFANFACFEPHQKVIYTYRYSCIVLNVFVSLCI